MDFCLIKWTFMESGQKAANLWRLLRTIEACTTYY